MIDTKLVGKLIKAQFPQWSELPIEPVEPQGWDNRTFRLGSTMSVRLPSAERYVAQVSKEQTWLPRLRPLLPLLVPEPLAEGAPSDLFPWPWSIYRWIDGKSVRFDLVLDHVPFARDLAEFLLALHQCPTAGAPRPSDANFHRGGALANYTDETHSALKAVGREIDFDTACAIWARAIETQWTQDAAWVHGDIAPGNLLTSQGRLSAVIDFGGCAVGDPACDLVIAWTLLDDRGRSVFRQTLNLDAATWARARAWALWKALLVVGGRSMAKPDEWPAEDVLALLFAEHDDDVVTGFG